MDMSIYIPIDIIVISIFIGYMYHYLKSEDYVDVFSLKSLLIGVVSGFLLSNIAIIIALINTPLFNIIYILSSYFIVLMGIVLSIVLVVVGGLLAITIKKIIIAYNQKKL